MERANNANAGLEAVKLNTDESQGGKSPGNVHLFDKAVAGMSQEVPSLRELEYLNKQVS